jgi:hypothetical protein
MANIIKDIDVEVYCGAANVPYTCGANRAIFGRILLKMAVFAPQVLGRSFKLSENCPDL